MKKHHLKQILNWGFLIFLLVMLVNCAQPFFEPDQLQQEDEEVIIVYSSPGEPLEIVETEEAIVNDNFANESTSNSRAVVGAGPLVSTNSITFKIATSTYAGSAATYIDIKFGTKNFRLYSYSGDYQRGSTHTFNFSNNKNWFESWDQDLWDDISFNTTHTDGIIFSNIKIIHSGQVILNYKPPTSLDYPTYQKLSFNSAMITTKYSHLKTTHTIVRAGLLELGKTDGDKYGTSGAWCSEFASYCIRRYGWATPTGSIGTSDMKKYYTDRNRLHTVSQVYNKKYTLGAGDYLSLWNGDHSAIFAEWVGSPTSFNANTQFKTIEGNTGSAVKVKTRILGDIDRIGQN
jgi:hypothetical protein